MKTPRLTPDVGSEGEEETKESEDNAFSRAKNSQKTYMVIANRA